MALRRINMRASPHRKYPDFAMVWSVNTGTMASMSCSLIIGLHLCLLTGCVEPIGAEPDGGDTVPGLFTMGDFLSGQGIPDLEICLMNTDNYDRTDAEGDATLSLPEEFDVGITIAGGGTPQCCYPCERVPGNWSTATSSRRPLW